MEQVHRLLLMILLGMFLAYFNFVRMLLVMLFARSSSQMDNRKINFLVLGEGPAYGIKGSFVSPDKNFNINYLKEK